jgi:hypothetical protein
MSLDRPAITINDSDTTGNPEIVMVLPVIGRSGTPNVEKWSNLDMGGNGVIETQSAYRQQKSLDFSRLFVLVCVAPNGVQRYG